MCMSAETSLATWTLAVVVAGYILCQSDSYTARWIAYLILAFTLIQLLEGLIWLSKDPRTRDLLTRLILVALMLQPLVNTWLAGRVFGPMKYIAYGYLLLFVYTIHYAFRDERVWNSVRGENGHLVWKKGNQMIFDELSFIGAMYLLGVTVPMLFIPGSVKWLVLGVTLGTGLWSYYSYNRTGEFSSMWCLSAALLVPISLFATFKTSSSDKSNVRSIR